jgi:DNA-binding transcriptional MerR regulator
MIPGQYQIAPDESLGSLKVTTDVAREPPQHAFVQVIDKEPNAAVSKDIPRAGLRISDAATRAGVSARTLRYYEELGLLAPSLSTPGGERRYTATDLANLDRILTLREVFGMNLDQIRVFVTLETRLEEVKVNYRAKKGKTTRRARAAQKVMLQELAHLNETLANRLSEKLDRMEAFQAKVVGSAKRCRDFLAELE